MKKGLLTINFNSLGQIVNDYDVLEHTKHIIEAAKLCEHTFINCGQATMVLAFRVHVKNGLIPHENITFKYGSDTIYCDKNAKLYCLNVEGKKTATIPKGFADVFITLCSKLF